VQTSKAYRCVTLDDYPKTSPNMHKDNQNFAYKNPRISYE